MRANDELDEVDWGEVSKRLTMYAWRRLDRVQMARHDLAEDFAFEAIRRHFDDNYADWDRARYPTLLEYLGSLVNGLIRNHLRKQSTRREAPRDLDEHALQMRMRTTSTPHDELERRELLEGVLRDLRALLQEDDILISLLDAMLEGVEKPAEQAATLDVSIQDIYNANRRLKRHYVTLRSALERPTL